jgi:hypothetical protein
MHGGVSYLRPVFADRRERMGDTTERIITLARLSTQRATALTFDIAPDQCSPAVATDLYSGNFDLDHLRVRARVEP